jgi:hypothetical protein
MAAATSAVIGVSGLISFDADVPSSEVVKRVDWIGASLVTVGLVLIVFVLAQGEIASDGWKTPCRSIAELCRSLAKTIKQISSCFLSSGLSYLRYSWFGSGNWNVSLKRIRQERHLCGHRHHL